MMHALFEAQIPRMMGKTTFPGGGFVDQKQLLAKIEKARRSEAWSLDLSGEGLTVLPGEIGSLTNLTHLWLWGNQLTALPGEIGNLTNLTYLWLQGNQLTALPEELGKLKRLTDLSIYGNPLTFPPASILDQGTKAILTFLSEELKLRCPVWSSKMILVGEGGVGKTSLLRILRGKNFRANEATTHGLEVQNLTYPHPEKPDVSITLNCWDFGGQEILHATHQFFLTDCSLFVLVWNARLGYQQGKLYYWLDMIQARASQSPVLIVATYTEDWSANLPADDILRKYPFVRGFLSISNQQQTGFEALAEEIVQAAVGLPLMGSPWPGHWWKVSQALRALAGRNDSLLSKLKHKMAGSQTIPYIYPNKLKALMAEHGVEGAGAQVLTTYLHQLGDLLYFAENQSLKDVVILDPSWVAHHISKALASNEIAFGLGYFKRDHMETVWGDVDPPARELFLNLMEEFDISYKTLEDQEISIVVEKLSADPPEGYLEEWQGLADSNEVTMRYYLNSSLPPGIPTWFIARTHRFTTHTHWRYGALFSDGTHHGLVRAFEHDRYLELSVRGPYPHNFFALLRDGLELTLARYPGLKIQLKIPCPGHSGQACTHEFVYEQLVARLNKKHSIECPESMEDLSVRQLLFGLTPLTLDDVAAKLDRLEHRQTQEFQNLGEMTQREFLKLQQIEQQKLGAVWPRLFVAWPADPGLLTRINKLGGKTICVQLICEAPGCWHQPDRAGSYETEYLPQWQENIQPVFAKLAAALKTVSPVLTAGFGISSVELGKRLKFMEELGKTLGDRDDWAGGRQEGDSFLREVLAGKQPESYGLRKVLTKEGHIFWVCDGHYEQFHRNGRFVQL